MDAHVLYEISSEAPFNLQKSWLIILITLVGFSFLAVQQMKEVRKKKSFGTISNMVLPSFGAVVAAAVAVFMFIHDIEMYDATVAAYKRGDYQIAEGYVENFHPMPAGGHDTESFTIDGVAFRYSSYTAAYGYRDTKVDGGVITGDGQHLRIGYTYYSGLGNVIVYIEELP